MVYNFNHGIGWASSGIEYAQYYRANLLRKANIPAKFIFTDMVQAENIERFTSNIGFLDDEIIWLYTAFSDIKIAPTTYTLDQFEDSIGAEHFTFKRSGKKATYTIDDNLFYRITLTNAKSDYVYLVEIVANGYLIRKDYYSYCKMYSELYAPFNNKAHLYGRHFYNEDGTIAYEEIIDNDNVLYRFPDRILYSKQQLIGYFTERLNLTEDDVVIVDRTTNIGQAIIQNASKARIGAVVHAEHFSQSSATEDNILWNNYYEYAFSQSNEIDFYITATPAQNQMIRQQFVECGFEEPNVITIPVGSIDELKYPDQPRKKHSIITASRLASEKHCDWILEAVVIAHDKHPDVSLDIYGKGPGEATLNTLIQKYNCSDYVHLMGQQKLDEIYKQYELYLSASQSEGFGLTLLEAIGSGLPIIGFDVRYGNKTFIDDGLNGYKIPIHEKMDKTQKVEALANALIRFFDVEDIDKQSEHSYEKAKDYLTDEVVKEWSRLLTKN